MNINTMTEITQQREYEMQSENNPILDAEVSDVLEESRYAIDTTPAENRPDPKRV